MNHGAFHVRVGKQIKSRPKASQDQRYPCPAIRYGANVGTIVDPIEDEVFWNTGGFVR